MTNPTVFVEVKTIGRERAHREIREFEKDANRVVGLNDEIARSADRKATAAMSRFGSKINRTNQQVKNFNQSARKMGVAFGEVSRAGQQFTKRLNDINTNLNNTTRRIRIQEQAQRKQASSAKEAAAITRRANQQVADQIQRANRKVRESQDKFNQVLATARRGLADVREQQKASAKAAQIHGKAIRELGQSTRATTAQQALLKPSIREAGKEARRAEAQLRRNSKATKELTKDTRGLGIQFKGTFALFKRLLAGIGIAGLPGAGVGIIGIIAAVFSELGARLEQTTRQLRVSTGAFDDFRASVRQFGVDQQTLVSGLESVQDAVDKLFRTGDQSLRTVFDQLGLSPKELSRLREQPIQLLRTIKEEIRAVQDQAEQRRLLDALGLDRSFINILGVSRDRIDEVNNALNALGATIDDKTSKQVAEIRNLFLAFWEVLRGRVLQAIADNSEAIINLTEKVLAKLPSIIDFIIEKSIQLVENFRTIQRVALTAAGAIIGSAFTPFGAAIGAVAGLLTSTLIPALGDFQTAVSDAEVQVGKITGRYKEAEDAADDLADANNRAANSFRNVSEESSNTSSIFDREFNPRLDEINELIQSIFPLFRNFTDLLRGLGRAAVEAAKGFAEFTINILNVISGGINSFVEVTKTLVTKGFDAANQVAKKKLDELKTLVKESFATLSLEELFPKPQIPLGDILDFSNTVLGEGSTSSGSGSGGGSNVPEDVFSTSNAFEELAGNIEDARTRLKAFEVGGQGALDFMNSQIEATDQVNEALQQENVTLGDVVKQLRAAGANIEDNNVTKQDAIDATARLNRELERYKNKLELIQEIEETRRGNEATRERIELIKEGARGFDSLVDSATEVQETLADFGREIPIDELTEILSGEKQIPALDKLSERQRKLLETKKEELEVQKALNNAQELRSLEDDLTLAQKQLDLVTLTADQRRIENAVLERKQSLLDRGLTKADEQFDKEVRITRQIEETKLAQERVTSAIEATTDVATDAFRDILEDGKADFEELADFIKDTLLDAFAQIARNAIIRPVVAPIVQGGLSVIPQALGGTAGLPGGQGGQSGATGSIGNAVSAGSLLSNIGSGLTTPSISASGLSSFAPSIFSAGAVPSSAASGTVAAGVGGNVFGLAGTGVPAAANPSGLATGISNLSTPLGIGGGLIGGLASSLVFENNLGNTIGSTVGGIGGGLAGSSLLGGLVGGPVGAGIGALLGSFGLGGLGSLFGEDKDFPFASARINASADGTRFDNVTSLDEGPRDEVQQLGQQVSQVADQLLNQIGAEIGDSQFQIGVSGGRGATPSGFFVDRVNEGAEGGNVFQNRADISGIENADLAAKEFVKLVLKNAEDVGPAVATAIKTSTADNLKDFASDIQFAGSFEDRIEALNKGVQSLSDTIAGQAEQNLNNLTTSVGDFLDKTQELELGIQKAEDASAEFLKRQLGITDAVDPERLSQAAQNQIRLNTTLEKIQDPTSDFRAVLDRVGISAEEAANATRQQIEANQSQRQAQLKLEAEGIANAGNAVTQFDQSITTLEEDLQRGIIGSRTFGDVLENRVASVVDGLSKNELQTLIGAVENNADAFENSEALVRLLTDELDNFGFTVESVTSAIRQSLEDIQNDAANAIGDQERLGNISAIANSPSTLLENAGLLRRSDTDTSDGEGGGSGPTDEQINNTIRNFVSNNPDVVAREGSVGSASELFVAADRPTDDLGQKIFDAFQEGAGRLPTPGGIDEVRRRLDEGIITEDNLVSAIEKLTEDDEGNPQAVRTFLENGNIRELLDFDPVQSAVDDIVTDAVDNSPDLSGVISDSLFSDISDQISKAQSRAEGGSLSESFIKDMNSFLDTLPTDAGPEGKTDVQDIVESIFDDLVRAGNTRQNELDRQDRDSGGGSGGSGTSGPTFQELLAQTRVRFPQFFNDPPKLEDRITAQGLSGTDVASTLTDALEGTPIGEVDFASVAAELANAAQNGDNLVSAVRILDNVFRSASDGISQASEQARQAREQFLRRDETAQERVDRLNAAIDAPALESQSAINDFVQGLDLTTEAGRNAFQTAQNLASALSQLSDTQQQQARNAVQDALSGVERAIQERQDTIQDRIQDAQNNVSDLENVFSVLERGVEGLRIRTDDFERTRRAAARNRLGGLLDQARSGDIPEADALSEVFDNLGRPDPGRFGTEQNFLRTTLQTQGDARALRSLTDDQLTAAEEQVKRLKDQQDTLDDQLETQRTIAERALGTFQATQSVETAIGNLQSAISGLPNGGAGNGGNGSGSTVTGRDALIQEIESRGGRLDLPTGGLNVSQARAVPLDIARQELERAGISIPGFAAGGEVNSGQLGLVGERGPELFVPDTGGSVLPNGITGELRALRKEVAELREVTRGGFRVNNKATVDMEKRQKRWYNDEIEAGNI